MPYMAECNLSTNQHYIAIHVDEPSSARVYKIANVMSNPSSPLTISPGFSNTSNQHLRQLFTFILVTMMVVWK